MDWGSTFKIATMVLHIVASLVLILVVLLQSGRTAGLSGSIAGGAETFFGKNKGRTIDAKLEKWTSAFAIIFLITCIVLGLLIGKLDNVSGTTDTPTDVTSEDANFNINDLLGNDGTEGDIENPDDTAITNDKGTATENPENTENSEASAAPAE